MSSRTLAETVREQRIAKKAGATSGPHPAFQAIGSALFLWTTFPTTDWSWLAWVALVPLFLLIKSERSRASVYFGVWAGGMVFWTLAIHWVRLSDETAWLGWLVMAFALSLFWPAFMAFARMAVRRFKLPIMFAAPVIWVAFEYARAYVATGFPWYYLAHSQHAVLPVIQIADLTGSLGVSFLIALVNAWVVDLLTLPLFRPSAAGARMTRPQSIRLGIIAASLLFTLGYGRYRINTADFRNGPRVALLQSSQIQRYQHEGTFEEYADRQLTTFDRLMTRASSLAEKPELLVWPETTYPYQYIEIDPKVDEPTLGQQIKQISDKLTVALRKEQQERVAIHLHYLADRVGIPLLIGGVTYEHLPQEMNKFNSALLVKPGEPLIQSYFKLHLVPFGEYVPLIKMLPWLTVLTPYRGTHVPSLAFGHGPKWLALGDYRIATAICFEDTVPQVVRQFFRNAPDGRHPDLILNMSNDGWFHGSSEHDMHLAVSVFRAIENRVPLARAANTGVSAVVDGNGQVLEALPKLQEGVLSRVIPLDDRIGLYSVFGDWLGQSCLAFTIGMLPLAWFWKRPEVSLPV